jgi:hypothetical protein
LYISIGVPSTPGTLLFFRIYLIRPVQLQVFFFCLPQCELKYFCACVGIYVVIHIRFSVKIIG